MKASTRSPPSRPARATRPSRWASASASTSSQPGKRSSAQRPAALFETIAPVSIVAAMRATPRAPVDRAAASTSPSGRRAAMVPAAASIQGRQ
nr:hypothetical protein [Methylobacterium segetis]